MSWVSLQRKYINGLGFYAFFPPLHYLLFAITLSAVRHYTSTVLRFTFLITPLVFSNFYLIFVSILLETILIVFMHIRVGSVGKGWRCKCRIP